MKPFNSEAVSGYEPPGWGSNAADEEGRILKPFLPAGKLEIIVKSEGHGSASRTIRLERGETTRVEIRLAK